jgi:MATE family multidrug resistance protein
MTELKTGNVSELWRVSYPMMVSFFSMMLMVFVDRIFLSWYSTESFNAATTAGTLAWGFILAWITLASMSEVFVSQYNGSKQFSKIGSPVWQTIWLTLLSYLFYLPFAAWGTAFIYDPTLSPNEYYFFQILMYFGPIFALIPAIGGFYIGRGNTKIMQWMAILGNLVNIVLDPILIFGIEGYIPSMGIKGAAIATGIGSLVEALLLLYLFLRKEHRQVFGTLKYSFDKTLFLKTIKVGLPPAIFIGLELMGWATFYHLMAQISPIHIFVASVCQTVLLLFLFFGMGIEKGTIAITGNFIGAEKTEHVITILKSGVKLVSGFALITALFLIIFPEPIINWFLQNPALLDPAMDLVRVDLDKTKALIRIGLISITFYILLENIRWILNGILTAAGDTLFLLTSGAINVWFLLLVPTYLFIVLPKADVSYSFIIWLVYSGVALSVVAIRFKQGKWKLKNLTKEAIVERVPSEELSETLYLE